MSANIFTNSRMFKNYLSFSARLHKFSKNPGADLKILGTITVTRSSSFMLRVHKYCHHTKFSHRGDPVLEIRPPLTQGTMTELKGVCSLRCENTELYWSATAYSYLIELIIFALHSLCRRYVHLSQTSA